jgi:hypothetical protein
MSRSLSASTKRRRRSVPVISSIRCCAMPLASLLAAAKPAAGPLSTSAPAIPQGGPRRMETVLLALKPDLALHSSLLLIWLDVARVIARLAPAHP